MATLFYFGTHGPENPTKATLPFFLARGAINAGHKAQIALGGDGAGTIKKSVIDEISGVGVPPLREILDDLAETDVEIFTWGGCAQARGVSEEDLEPFNSVFINPEDLANLMAAADKVITL